MSYIGNEPIVSATRTVTEITATAGQTVFTANGGYTVGFIDVFVNGSQLTASDFTATDGSTITLNEAATVNDIVRLVAWGTFQAANITSGSLSAGGITWSQSGGVTLPRIDSSNEGGQLNFNRASDNTATWSIDSFGNTSTPSLRFLDGANLRAVIDGSGNVGIGTSSPNSSYRLTVDGSSGNLNGIRVQGGVPRIAVWGDGATSIGNGPNFYMQNTTGPNVWAASMQMGPSSEMIFFQYPNGVWNERMRITSGGSVCVNNTTAQGGQPFYVRGFNGTGSAGFQVFSNGSGAIDWYNASAGYVASVVVNSGSVNYNTTSDYRLKENIAPMQGALAKVQLLKPVTYTWKSDGSAGQGFIAHELQEVVPDCVTGEKDAVDEEGNPRYQGVDTSFLVATLTAAIQEQQAQIEAIKAELDNAKAEIELLKGAN